MLLACLLDSNGNGNRKAVAIVLKVFTPQKHFTYRAAAVLVLMLAATLRLVFFVRAGRCFRPVPPFMLIFCRAREAWPVAQRVFIEPEGEHVYMRCMDM